MQNDTLEKTKSWALISGILGVVWGLFVGLSPIVMDQKTLWGSIIHLAYPLAVVKDGFQVDLLYQQQILSIAIAMIWVIFLISWMSFIYYRKDRRVPRWVSRMLLIAGILGVASTLPYTFTILRRWDSFVEQFTPVGGYALPLLAMVCLSGILGGISGVGDVLSLKQLDESLQREHRGKHPLTTREKEELYGS